MESKEFFINLEIEPLERFDMARFMLNEFGVFDPLTSHVISNIKKLESGGQYTVSGEDFRPDSISQKIYGTTEYWWVILIYNEKLSFNDVQHGEELQFPSIDSLEELYFKLKVNQNITDKED